MTILKNVSAPTIDLGDVVSEGSASLTTDKPDYAPTDTALITGSNLLPNTAYTLTISSTDNPPTSKNISVASDANGVFAFAYQLDGNYRPNYQAELKDSDGNIVATTNFTDSVTTTILVSNLQPDWTTGVWAAYYAPDSETNPAGESPGSTAVYDKREAGIIKAGITPEADGHFRDEGLLAFQVPNVDISSFALQALTYDVENQTGPNPVWVRIRLVGGVQYQFVPMSNPAGWHTVDAAAGQWRLMDDNGDGTGPMMTLAEVATANPGASVDRVYLTLGMGDSYNVSPGVGTVAWVDTVTIGSTTYDFVLAPTPNPTTNPATNVNTTNATVNGTVSTFNADDTSFWLGTTSAGPFTSSTNPVAELPSGWNGIDSLTQPANAAFSHTYSSLTPNTKYYYVAWALVGSTWYPGEIMNFTTSPIILPSVPTNGQPNNSYKTTNDFYFTWDASTGTYPITYEFQSSGSSNVDSNGSLINAWDSITNGNSEQNHLTSPQIHSTGAQDGTYYWQVRAIDTAGNKSVWSSIWKMTIDTTAPPVPTPLSPADNSFRTTATQTLIDWSDVTDPSTPVTYQYESSNSNSLNPDGSFTSPVYVSGALPTSQIPTPGTPEGIYYWQVRAIDAAGNKSAWSTPWKVTVDNTAPTVALVFPTPGPSAINFQAVFSENVNSTEATNPANYFLNNWPGAGGSGNLVGHATISYNSTSYTATITFTTPGWYISPEQQWGVQNIHDLAGNVQQTNPYTEYSTPMVAPVTTDSGTDSNWHTSATITLTCVDNPGGSGCKNTYYTTDGSTPTTSSLSGNSIVLNTDGVYTIKYFSVDNAGNEENVKTAANQVKIDETAPTIGAIPPAGDYNVTSMLVTLISTESGSGLAGIYYTTDGTTTPDKTSSTLYTGPITVDHDMTIKAIAYDNVGNVSNVLSAIYGVLPIISSEQITLAGDNSLTITWTTNFPTTSKVVYDTFSHPDPLDLTTGPNYGYTYSTGTLDTSPEVINHSVTITGVTVNQTYYYRAISNGSPEAISDETPFATYYTFGLPGDGLSDGASTGNGGGAPSPSLTAGVLGAATSLAYTGGTGGEVLGAGTQPEVLGTATKSAEPTPSVSPTGTKQTLVSNSMNWTLGYVSLALIILVILAYLIYRKKRKNTKA
ncbi:MAG: chitobiase/beta-hexosaminidase C-terminal domain-containing protein [Candidatus Levyibacteriota bacterium]